MTAESDGHDDDVLDDDLDVGLRAAFSGDGVTQDVPSGSEDADRSQTIAGYRILGEIGVGGMGVVYQAEQQSPRRRVALKIIKEGMDTRQVVARFEQERQALAMMDHPNIAKVFDAGATESGRPFFVMELVEGDLIGDYCDKHRLSVANRLELFEQVCHAVQHAHTKGLIHRDIKPSNILVSSRDGEPIVKVIDFGIAKAIAARPSEKTVLTEHHQLIGTLQYMSPEQAEGSLDIDTRSDIYSLGIVLYEILTGTPPFDLRTLGSAMLSEIQRQICEVDPPRPSTRLRDSTTTIAELAAQRGTEPQRLSSMVYGELDWIAMKALEKDRDRRYASALELARDVRAYLDGGVVEAAPPSRVYRLRKFVRRNRAAVSGGLAVLLTLILGILTTAWQAKVAAKQRDFAEAAQRAEAEQRRVAVAQRDSASQVAIFMSETLSGVRPSVALGRDTTMLKEMMDHASRRITSGELGESKEAELRLRLAIGTAYIDLALFREAEVLLEAVLPLAQSLFPGDSMETAHCHMTISHLARDRGDLGIAESQCRDGMAMLQRLHSGDHPRIATALHELGIIARMQGRLEEAERSLRDGLAMTERLSPGDDRERVSSLIELAQLIHARGLAATAEPICREALAISERLHGPDHPRVALVRNNLAVILLDRNRHDLALPLMEESLAALRRMHPGDNPYVATAIGNLAVAIQDHGDVTRAELLFREALAMHRQVYPGDHRQVARTLDNLAKALMSLGREEEAESLMTDSVAMRRRLQAGDHQDLAIGLVNLARILAKRGRRGEGEALVREALAMRRRLFQAPSGEVAAFLVELSHALRARGARSEAEEALREALAIQDVVFPGSTRPRAVTLLLLGKSRVAASDAEAAEPLVREACEIDAKLDGADRAEGLKTKAELAQLWWSQGRFDRSIPLYEEVVAQRSAVYGRREAETLTAIINLGVNYQAAGRIADALPLLEEARALAAEVPDIAWSVVPLLEIYVRSKRGQDAAALEPEVRAWMQRALAPDDPEVAARLHWLGEQMAAVGRWGEAQAAFRDCLEHLERAVPDHWRRFQAMSRLGEALSSQGEFAAAEPLLHAGYEGLEQRAAGIPEASAADELRDAADRLVRHFDSRAGIEPEGAHGAAAAQWRVTRDTHARREP